MSQSVFSSLVGSWTFSHTDCRYTPLGHILYDGLACGLLDLTSWCIFHTVYITVVASTFVTSQIFLLFEFLSTFITCVDYLLFGVLHPWWTSPIWRFTLWELSSILWAKQTLDSLGSVMWAHYMWIANDFFCLLDSHNPCIQPLFQLSFYAMRCFHMSSHACWGLETFSHADCRCTPLGHTSYGCFRMLKLGFEFLFKLTPQCVYHCGGQYTHGLSNPSSSWSLSHIHHTCGYPMASHSPPLELYPGVALPRIWLLWAMASTTSVLIIFLSPPPTPWGTVSVFLGISPVSLGWR